MAEKSRSDPNAQLASKLLLDIKALMLLNDTDEAARRVIDENLLASHDEHITRFFSLSQIRKRYSGRSDILIALGELILASFLVIAGLAVLAPSVIGFTSPQQLLTYFDQVVSSVSAQSLASPAIPLLEFLFALALLLSAFYLLRSAAASLKEFGPTAAHSQ